MGSITKYALNKAIRDIEVAREIHDYWEKYIEVPLAANEKVRCEDAVGDACHHRQWIRKYDNVLKVLRVLKGWVDMMNGIKTVYDKDQVENYEVHWNGKVREYGTDKAGAYAALTLLMAKDAGRQLTPDEEALLIEPVKGD